MLIIFQVHGRTFPLSTVFQRHKDEWKKSPKANKYLCDVSPLAAAISVWRRLVQSKSLDTIGKQETDLLLRKFALAVVDSRHRYSCIQKFTDFCEQVTE